MVWMRKTVQIFGRKFMSCSQHEADGESSWSVFHRMQHNKSLKTGLKRLVWCVDLLLRAWESWWVRNQRVMGCVALWTKAHSLWKKLLALPLLCQIRPCLIVERKSKLLNLESTLHVLLMGYITGKFSAIEVSSRIVYVWTLRINIRQ